MMQRGLLLVFLAAAGCPEQKSTAVNSGVPERPATDTVEGHGGIAIDDPGRKEKPAVPIVPQAPTPHEPKVGAVDPSDFMMREKEDAGDVEARERAMDLYMAGYQIRDRNPAEAIRLFREVVRLTPADDELHQKAQAQVKELAEPNPE